VFHKIVKSGCQAEQSKLRTAERLVNLLAMFRIQSWPLTVLSSCSFTAPEVTAR
jgi:hypothetical protein